MPKLAARLALSAAAASVLLTGFEALRLRRPRALAQPRTAAPTAAETSDAVPRLASRPRPQREGTPAARPRPLGIFAMARIHGRVVGPGSRGDLDIEVEDARRGYEPRMGDDGEFEIHLPPGDYAVMARAGDQVAFAEAAGLGEGEDREIVLMLDKAVAIAGRVDGCDGPCAEVSVDVSGPGVGHDDSTRTDPHGEFSIEGLIPGRVYDVELRLRGKRRLAMKAIAAPRKGLRATLEPGAVLAGGFGVAAGEKCPMRAVVLQGEPPATAMPQRFDRACRFRFAGLAEATVVHLTADGEGWHFQADIPLPEHGDPPFLCLRPPCREPEPGVPASLEVLVERETQGPVYVRATAPDEDRPKVVGCESRAKPCLLENLRAGQTAKVDVRAAPCEPRSYTVELHPGRNILNFACARLQQISGVVRGPHAADGVWVRCSADAPAQPAGRMFFLQCADGLEAIEYQLVEDGPWLVAFVSSEEDGTGFVEIMAD
jgi:hypothetical protein